jgi:hypothetical protein
MMKLKKLFSFGMVAALALTMGVMLGGCAEDPEEEPETPTPTPPDTTPIVQPVYHTAWVFNGKNYVDNEGNDYEAETIVPIVAVPPVAGRPFISWSAFEPVDEDGYIVPGEPLDVDFGNATNSTTTFTMPGQDVFVGAWFEDPADADVRYTWEAAEQANILSISASYLDVLDWYENVFLGDSYDPSVNATEFPVSRGSAWIPNNIFSSSINSTQYKGTYQQIAQGSYTAVCTVVDTQFDTPDTTDIVANYDIEPYLYTEIAFDVGTFIAGEDDKGWFDEVREESDDNPRLQKAPGKKLAKKLKKGNVTYYVLHRNRK